MVCPTVRLARRFGREVAWLPALALATVVCAAEPDRQKSVPAAATPIARPCSPQDVAPAPGRWVGLADDVTLADPGLPRSHFPSLYRNIDRVVDLLRRADPAPAGVESRFQRSIRGHPVVAGGSVPHGASIQVFELYCVPDSDRYADSRGRFHAAEGTGARMYVHFNSLGGLARDIVPGLRSDDDRPYLYVPRADSELRGVPLFDFPGPPFRQHGRAVILTPDGGLPWRLVSRERYLRTRIRLLDQRLAGGTAADPRRRALIEAERRDFEAALAALSPQGRAEPASIKDPAAPLERMFVPVEAGGIRIGTLNPDYFRAGRLPSAIRIIVVHWQEDDSGQTATEAVRRLRENVDIAALRSMLSR